MALTGGTMRTDRLCQRVSGRGKLPRDRGYRIIRHTTRRAAAEGGTVLEFRVLSELEVIRDG